MLLDTHIFLWWLFDDPQLPSTIKKEIQDGRKPVLISAASVWEIATKFRLGKLPEAGEVARNVPYWIRRAGFEPLPVTPEHAQLAGEWRVAHRDPFDRMLAAQANLEEIPLATNDAILKNFPIVVIGG